MDVLVLVVLETKQPATGWTGAGCFNCDDLWLVGLVILL
jgi:hypothetical protein